MDVLLGLCVGGHRVGEHADRAALHDGFGEELAHASVRGDDLAGDLRGVERRRGRGVQPHEFGVDAARGRRERVRREHVPVGRKLEHRRAGLPDDAHAGGLRFPCGVRQRVPLHAVRQPVGRRRRRLFDVPRGREPRGDVRDARVKPRVARPAHEPVEVGDRLLRAVAVQQRAHQREVRLGGGRGACRCRALRAGGGGKRDDGDREGGAAGARRQGQEHGGLGQKIFGSYTSVTVERLVTRPFW